MNNSIPIETTYNVTIRYNQAPIWDRVWAYVIDNIIKFSYLFLVFSVVVQLVDFLDSYYIIFVFFLPFMFYSIIFESITDGKTPGKIALGLQVVSADGQNLTFMQLLTRWLVRIFDFYLFGALLAFLSAVVTDKSQRIGDLVANTAVISTKRNKYWRRTTYVKLKDDYEPVFPQAALLEDQDIELLKGIVESKSQNRFDLLKEAAEQLSMVLQVKKTESSEKFVATIVRDYNFYLQREEAIIEDLVTTNAEHK